MEYTKLSHCVFHCRYHIVLPTKYRRKIFNDGIFSYFKDRLVEVSKYYPLIRIIEVNHDKDHIHLFVSIPPTMSVGSVVRILKSNLSRRLKQKFSFLKEVYWGADGIWSDGYFVSTAGINADVIQRYIRNQGKIDCGQALA